MPRAETLVAARGQGGQQQPAEKTRGYGTRRGHFAEQGEKPLAGRPQQVEKTQEPHTHLDRFAERGGMQQVAKPLARKRMARNHFAEQDARQPAWRQQLYRSRASHNHRVH